KARGERGRAASVAVGRSGSRSLRSWAAPFVATSNNNAVRIAFRKRGGQGDGGTLLRRTDALGRKTVPPRHGPQALVAPADGPRGGASRDQALEDSRSESPQPVETRGSGRISGRYGGSRGVI